MDHDEEYDDDEYDLDEEELDEAEDDGDLSPLVEGAVALHEIYLALQDGGFSEWEGLRILAWLISEQGTFE